MRTRNEYIRASEYVHVRRLDWNLIFLDLAEADKSLSEIRDLIGLPWSTMCRYKNGTEPKHSVASALLQIHARYCGEDLTQQRIDEAEIITQLR